MPTIKLSTNRITVNTSGVTSSNVSSSLNGNINLIKSQVAQKTNDYINIKNAVNILEIYSNWNGYIKIYTEVQSNFVVGDTAYITYASTKSMSNIFNLENPSVPDEGSNRYYLGYKILYVNQSKNEIVINRHYNDIPSGYSLKYQQISKISCRGGYLYKSVSDGVVFYNCNILNVGFSTISGIVSINGIPTPGVMVTLSGSKRIHTTDSNGYYILNSVKGDNIIKSYKDGYIINNVTVHINSDEKKTQNISLISGNNNITISSNIPINFVNNKVPICSNNSIIFTSTNLGYSQNINYQWFIIRNGISLSVGTNNKIFSYNNFNTDDVVYCVVRDNDFNINYTSNNITVEVTPPLFEINTDFTTIHNYDSANFYAFSSCYVNPSFQWYVNGFLVGTNNNLYTSSPYSIPNDAEVLCVMSGIYVSNTIIMNVI